MYASIAMSDLADIARRPRGGGRSRFVLRPEGCFAQSGTVRGLVDRLRGSMGFHGFVSLYGRGSGEGPPRRGFGLPAGGRACHRCSIGTHVPGEIYGARGPACMHGGAGGYPSATRGTQSGSTVGRKHQAAKGLTINSSPGPGSNYPPISGRFHPVNTRLTPSFHPINTPLMPGFRASRAPHHGEEQRARW